MKIDELKSELETTQEGCGRKLMHPLYCDLRSLCGKDKWESKTIYCPTCQAKLSTLIKTSWIFARESLELDRTLMIGNRIHKLKEIISYCETKAKEHKIKLEDGE